MWRKEQENKERENKAEDKAMPTTTTATNYNGTLVIETPTVAGLKIEVRPTNRGISESNEEIKFRKLAALERTLKEDGIKSFIRRETAVLEEALSSGEAEVNEAVHAEETKIKRGQNELKKNVREELLIFRIRKMNENYSKGKPQF